MKQSKVTNTVWHQATVTREQRESLNAHKSVILWFTGLSGAGKSSLAHAVEAELFKQGSRTFVFDGDNVRHGLCSDLGFSAEDRVENIRRVGEMAKLFLDAGVIALTAFISPFLAERDRVRSLVPSGQFLEIYCKCSLKVCEERDVKGLYKRARNGEVKNFTGISSEYQAPLNAEITLQTDQQTIDKSVEQVINYLQENGYLS